MSVMRFRFPAHLLALLTLASQAPGAGKLSFNRDVRPILSDNCFACHGFDAKKRKAELRLDTPEGALAVKDGAQAVKPGDPAASGIIQRALSTDADEIMPPPDSHKKLSPRQIETLKQWISEGASYQKHWSFEAPVKPPVPPASAGTQARNAVDRFIQAELREHGLEAAPEATKEQLIRRVTLDLTGLPPTIAEVDAYLADANPDAYDRVVERLLKSQRYGEHMGRQWLDAARYGDTHGLHLDNERSMWPYRDWVVRAFNDNLSYEDFTIWQLAGDLLPNATIDQQIASGFNRCNVTTSEGGSIAEEFVFRYAVDRTETTMAVWMGLTAGCCVCHDHKFDPITTKDFYSMYAFFNSAADPAMDGNILLTPPVLRLATDTQKKELAGFEKDIAGTQSRIREAIAKLNYTDPATSQPPPPVQTSDVVWFEDAFPPGAKVEFAGEHPTQIITQDKGPVASGKAALKRSAKGVAQDFFAGGAQFEIPANGRLSVQCYLDPKDMPTAIMLQFHTGGWNHRAVWGDEGAIPFGQVRTPERVRVGALPEPGKWARLEVPVEKLNLKPGMKVTGYAFTQFGGTVRWDRLAVSSRVDPAKDPQWSWKVWTERSQGKRVEGLPNDLQTLVRGKKAVEWPEADMRRLKEWWFENEFQGAREIVAGARAEKLALESRKKALEDLIPATFIMADMPQRRDAFVMQRGQYDKPGEPVKRRTPEVFAPLPAKADHTRVDLARWLLAPENPLTARVAVNRFWQQFFGLGLVKTSNDFGSQGEAPSHPELLDWLAVTFRESGWDVKQLVRTIVTSHTYRQSARATEALVAADPENRLLARAPRFRVDAEMVRDSALFVSGLLSPRIGGKGVRPYQPPNIWEPVGFGGSNTRVYVQDKGESLYRRSLYTFIKRTAPAPNMVNFDATARESYCLRRERSNTPLQALNLMNDIQYVEAARNLAQRVLLERGGGFDSRLTFLWRSVLARFPTPSEVETVRSAHERHVARYQKDTEAAKQLISYGESKASPAINPSDLAAWTLTASLVMNLDEAVVK